LPLLDFAQKIAGDTFTIASIIPKGVEPHDWEPSPKDIAALSASKAVFINGRGMEQWLKAVDSANVVDTSVNIAVDENAADPHIWLSPENAKQQMAVIKDTFVQLDPGNADVYEARYEDYAAQFDALDDEFRTQLGDAPNKTIVVSHAAYGYLCRDYGLTEIAVEGIFADAEPDPKTMRDIVEMVKSSGIKYILSESKTNTKVIDTIAKETGAEVLYLSPIEIVNKGEEDDDYFSLMLKDLDTLVKALGE